MIELPRRAARPSDPEHWEGPESMREIAQRIGQDEVLRYLHWPRRLTVLSGVGIADETEGVVMHLSVSHWGLYEPERATDLDCHFALDHFGAPDKVEELISPDPNKRARDFIWPAHEQVRRKSA